MNMFDEIEGIKKELPKAKAIRHEFKSMKFNFYQGFALVVYAILFCLGIILGNLFPTCGTSSAMYSGTCLTTEFNMSLMLGIWFIGLIICVFIFAIGHVIQLLDKINKSLNK